MNIPSIINHNYYVVRAIKTNRTWICEAKRFDDKKYKLYYYYGTYELSSKEHKYNDYLSDNYYDILPDENDEVRLATPEEIDILTDVLEKNGIKTTLPEVGDKAKAPDLKGEDYSNKRFRYKIPNGYKFDTVDNGNIILKPIKSKYPKTYEECCKALNLTKYPPALVPNKSMFISQYKDFPHYYEIQKLAELLICRDAYWKIAGEEMGLDKPWKPVYKSLEDNHYFTICTFNGEIDKSATSHRNAILAFPTIEMRDTFYENFKDLIEQCKELL